MLIGWAGVELLCRAGGAEAAPQRDRALPEPPGPDQLTDAFPPSVLWMSIEITIGYVCTATRGNEPFLWAPLTVLACFSLSFFSSFKAL